MRISLAFVAAFIAFSILAASAAMALGKYDPDDFRPPDVHGAPGPLMGAGLPVLAVGYGVYWLATRRRKKY